MLDFIRIACAVPDVAVANVKHNAEEICKYIAQADEQNVDLLVFPELALTGATCADLFFEDALHAAVRKGMKQIVDCSREHPDMTIVVGLPVRAGMQMFNCAAVVQNGDVCDFATKDTLTSDERRWFTPGRDHIEGMLRSDDIGLEDSYSISLCQSQFDMGGNAKMGIVFGNDLYSPVSKASALAMSGMEIIVNLAAAPEIVGSRARREKLIREQSDVLHCVYAYCSAGMMESTQDGVFSGHSVIAENGVILAENDDLTDSGYLMVMDCDLGKVRALRNRSDVFKDCATNAYEQMQKWITQLDVENLRSDGTLYHLNKLPFIPETRAERDAYCREVFQIQVSGLKRRLKAIGCNPVLGISGGLDSTLALLVAVEAVRQLGCDASTVYGITLPCFGTSDRDRKSVV